MYRFNLTHTHTQGGRKPGNPEKPHMDTKNMHRNSKTPTVAVVPLISVMNNFK